MANTLEQLYICSKCDAQFTKWNGRCAECGAWGTVAKATVDKREKERSDTRAEAASVVDFKKLDKQANVRLKTGIGEVDRVLGGGIVPGSLVLISGDPGIGKSTIIAQIADSIKEDVVYVSGEESAPQIKSRLERLGCGLDKIKLITDVNVEKIIAAVENIKPKLAIIDSIQTVYSMLSEAEPGSINQIRTSTVRFLEVAKKNNIAIILVGHITKDGQVAGPKSLEHIVDTVVHLESEKGKDYRLLRAAKNRFGSVNELGIFEMTGKGFKEVTNPTGMFLDVHEENMAGSVISSVIEGTRPFLIEVQALATKTVFGYPQRKASGFDLNRLQVLTAVLTKRAGINLTNQDVILNVVGGLKISDPSIDLAVCMAIISSVSNQAIDRKTLVLGEVGLSGEVRNVGKLKERLAEAKKLGYKKAIVPAAAVDIAGIEIERVKNISEIVSRLIKT